MCFGHSGWIKPRLFLGAVGPGLVAHVKGWGSPSAPSTSCQKADQMSAPLRPPFQGRIRGVDGSQVGEQKGACLVFPPIIQYQGLAVTPHLPPLLSADGCSVPVPAPTHPTGSHLPWSVRLHAIASRFLQGIPGQNIMFLKFAG